MSEGELVIRASKRAADAKNLAPEAVVELLRNVQQRIPEVAPLTSEQREALRKHERFPDNAIQGSISAIGAQQLVSDANRWTAVVYELRKMLNGVEGANLIRRQRAALIAVQAYIIACQLVRNPEHADLRPHVENMKRLRAIHRRRRRAGQAPEEPAATEGAGGGEVE